MLKTAEFFNTTPEKLDSVIMDNLRVTSVLGGYLAETFLREELELLPGFTNITKPNENRRDISCDIVFTYNTTEYLLEVKTVDTTKDITSTVQNADGTWKLISGVKKAGTHDHLLPNGNTKRTASTLKSTFDILAVSCYPILKEWKFIFAFSEDVTSHSGNGWSEEDKKYKDLFFSTAARFTWPPEPPHYDSLVTLLESKKKPVTGFCKSPGRTGAERQLLFEGC